MKFTAAFISAVLFFTSSALADGNRPKQDQADQLVPGNEIQLNIATVDNVLFKLDVPHTKGVAAELPIAKIVSTYGGFECEVLGVALKSTKATSTGSEISTFEISVDWVPGADSSGCFVEVKAESLETARARVYMSF